jgi:hypothetical protein
MSNPNEKATAYLCKLQADRKAAMKLRKEKKLEAMLIKAREEGFREAMEIFRLNSIPAIVPNDIEEENQKLHRRKRRDIRQMIIQELSYSAKAMTTKQISKAVDYLQERTDTVLKRLENEGKIVQNRDGLWEIIVINGAPPDSLTVVA